MSVCIYFVFPFVYVLLARFFLTFVNRGGSLQSRPERIDDVC